MEDLQGLIAELEVLKNKDVEYRNYANETQEMCALSISYAIKGEIKSINAEIFRLREEI